MWDEDLVTLLEGYNAAFDFGVSLFVSTKATTPNGEGPYCMIKVTPGMEPEETHDNLTQPAYQRPGAQLLFVAKDYVDARTMARLAYLAMRVRNRPINGVHYRSIKALQEPFDLGPDALNRAQVVFNVLGDKSFS
jgi:hypothetical protein